MTREKGTVTARSSVAMLRGAATIPPQCGAGGMTSAAIGLLLELHDAVAPVSCGVSQVLLRAWSDFKHEGLLPGNVSTLVPAGSLTAKGRAHVEALCTLPLPVAVTRTVWQTPKQKEE